jgi:hypothetical protein
MDKSMAEIVAHGMTVQRRVTLDGKARIVDELHPVRFLLCGDEKALIALQLYQSKASGQTLTLTSRNYTVLLRTTYPSTTALSTQRVRSGCTRSASNSWAWATTATPLCWRWSLTLLTKWIRVSTTAQRSCSAPLSL